MSTLLTLTNGTVLEYDDLTDYEVLPGGALYIENDGCGEIYGPTAWLKLV